MAKKRPKPGEAKKPKSSEGAGPRQPNRTPAFTVYARIDPAYGVALERYLDATRPRPSLTAVVETALEDFLRKAGFWPLPADATGETPAEPKKD